MIRAGPMAASSRQERGSGLRKATVPPTPCGTGLEAFRRGLAEARACRADACRRERRGARDASMPQAGRRPELCGRAGCHEKAVGWPLCRPFPPCMRTRTSGGACGDGESVPHGCGRGPEGRGLPGAGCRGGYAGAAFPAPWRVFALPASAKEGRAGANVARWPASRRLSAGGNSGGIGRRPEACRAAWAGRRCGCPEASAVPARAGQSGDCGCREERRGSLPGRTAGRQGYCRVGFGLLPNEG